MNIYHFKDVSIVKGGISIQISLSKYDSRFTNAQKWLDNQVFQSMKPYMPIQTGSLIQRTQAENMTLLGSGRVVAAAKPYGRFLYMGKVMVDPETGSPFARAGVEKVVTNRDLTFQNPLATAKWFDTAKANHGKVWVDGVKKIVGGG